MPPKLILVLRRIYLLGTPFYSPLLKSRLSCFVRIQVTKTESACWKLRTWAGRWGPTGMPQLIYSAVTYTGAVRAWNNKGTSWVVSVLCRTLLVCIKSSQFSFTVLWTARNHLDVCCACQYMTRKTPWIGRPHPCSCGFVAVEWNETRPLAQ